MSAKSSEETTHELRNIPSYISSQSNRIDDMVHSALRSSLQNASVTGVEFGDDPSSLQQAVAGLKTWTDLAAVNLGHIKVLQHDIEKEINADMSNIEYNVMHAGPVVKEGLFRTRVQIAKIETLRADLEETIARLERVIARIRSLSEKPTDPHIVDLTWLHNLTIRDSDSVSSIDNERSKWSEVESHVMSWIERAQNFKSIWNTEYS